MEWLLLLFVVLIGVCAVFQVSCFVGGFRYARNLGRNVKESLLAGSLATTGNLDWRPGVHEPIGHSIGWGGKEPVVCFDLLDGDFKGRGPFKMKPEAAKDLGHALLERVAEIRRGGAR